MTQRKTPVTLKTLSATAIYNLAEPFTQQHPRSTTQEPKPRYPEALRLTPLQVAQQAAYRQRRFGLAPHLLSQHALPALGTLLYRLKPLPESHWHAGRTG